MRTHADPRVNAALAVVMLAALAGCTGGDELNRQSVSGSVQLDGKPLPKGLITFMPENPELPTQGGAAIADGKYSIASAEGLAPGKYRVVITSGGDAEAPKDTTNDMPGMAPPVPKELIPAEYNSKSTLTAEVKAGGDNKFDFELKRQSSQK